MKQNSEKKLNEMEGEKESFDATAGGTSKSHPHCLLIVFLLMSKRFDEKNCQLHFSARDKTSIGTKKAKS